MSYGALVFFDTDGNELGDSPTFQNGWGMGPAIWDMTYPALGATFMFDLGQDKYPGTVSEQYQALIDDKLNQKNLFLGTTLLMTLLEPTMVARKDWPAVINHIVRTFKRDTVEGLEERIAAGKVVNHWAEICRELEKRMDDESVLGFGLYNTSVNEYPFRGEYDEEKDEYGPWSPTENAWWLVPATDTEGARRVPYTELSA